MEPAAHLTCVGSSCGEIRETLRDYHSAGVRHVVGRYAATLDRFRRTLQRPVPGGYRSTAELVADAAKMGFEVSVRTYPERHPQSFTLLHDIEILKQKVDAGATRAITQFFFDNSAYFRFLDVAAAAGLDVPIVPGIFPGTELQADEPISPGEQGRACRNGSPIGSRGWRSDAATRRLVAAAVCGTGDRPHRPWRKRSALLHHEPRRCWCSRSAIWWGCGLSSRPSPFRTRNGCRRR